MKKLLVLSLMVLLLVSFGVVQAKTINITYWTFFGGGDAEFMTDMITRFNDAHPDINIKEQRIPWGAYYDRLTPALAAGKGPDIGILHATYVPTYASKGAFVALDSYIDKYNFPIDNIVPRLRKAVTYKGSIYAIPIDTHPEVMFYNKDIFKAIGWVNDDGSVKLPQTPEEFVQLGKDVKDYNPDLVPFAMDTEGLGCYRIWFGLLHQQGGKLFDENGKPSFNNEKGKKALSFLHKIVAEKKYTELGTDAQILFKQGDAAIQIGGVWNTGVHEQQPDLNFGATVIPSIFGQKANWANSHVIMVPKGRKAPSDTKMKAIITFLDWMTGHGYLWARAGHIPSRMSVLDSDEFNKLNYRPEYANAANYASYLPKTNNPSEIEDKLSQYIEAVYHDQFSIDEALTKMEQALANIPQ